MPTYIIPNNNCFICHQRCIYCHKVTAQDVKSPVNKLVAYYIDSYFLIIVIANYSLPKILPKVINKSNRDADVMMIMMMIESTYIALNGV